MQAPQAYPLQWPVGKQRTPSLRRERARFSRKGAGWVSDGNGGNRYDGAKQLSIADAVGRLQGELDRLGARLPVVSTNIETKLDGTPYSNRRAPDDPGAACYFQLRERPIVLACDHYDRVADNIAAIAAHIEAMRAMERHGVGSLEQMFAGFAALPPALAVDDWRTVLGNPGALGEAEREYRERMKHAHPDVNRSEGAEIVAARLNAAIGAARKHFTPTEATA